MKKYVLLVMASVVITFTACNKDVQVKPADAKTDADADLQFTQTAIDVQTFQQFALNSTSRHTKPCVEITGLKVTNGGTVLHIAWVDHNIPAALPGVYSVFITYTRHDNTVALIPFNPDGDASVTVDSKIIQGHATLNTGLELYDITHVKLGIGVVTLYILGPNATHNGTTTVAIDKALVVAGQCSNRIWWWN